MDLWIRSQDRKRLAKINYAYIMENGKYIIYGETCDSGPRLGVYETLDRALEVLDEIQKILEPKIILNNEGRDCVALDGTIYRTNLVSNVNSDIQQLSIYVYQMPEE